MGSSGAGKSGKESARESGKKLLVIDGANAVYRAFFALPSLRAPDGTPTNAALGFASMLAKLLREEAPDFVAIAFDPRGGSFRKEVYADYKANRDAQPEDLSAQFPLVREIVEAFRVPVLEVEGFEADDVIGTLVEGAPDDLEVAIVSSDKDLMQLVSERVVLVDGIKDKRMGPADVEARFGVPPGQMLDVRALVGDPSDNIPGVKGIGEKGAAKLIGEWGSLEKLLAHAGDVKAKRAREALEQHADDARLSKELATLRTDVALPVGLDGLVRQEPDVEALREVYTRLGFTRLLASLEQEAGRPAASQAAEIDVQVVASLEELEAVGKALEAVDEPAVLFVCEEGSAVAARLVGVAFALPPSPGEEGEEVAAAAYVPLRDGGDLAGGGLAFDDALPLLAELLGAKREGAWLGAGVKQAQSVAAERGWSLPLPAFDVPLAAFLVDPTGQHSLAALALQYLGRRIDSFEEVAGRGAKAIAAGALPVPVLSAWAAAQVQTLAELAPLLRDRLAQDGLAPLFEEVELPLTRVLSRMERQGVRIDEAKLEELAEHYGSEIAALEKRIYASAGEEFLIGSPKQLQTILFEKLKLPAIKKTKTGYSTAEGVLEQLAEQHELPGLVLAWRHLSKLKSTYIDALPPLVDERSGRVHPSFNQTGAATGRMSATNPNVQNIPIRTPEGIRIREAFVPAEGSVLLSADYSQVELRVLAHYSGDESLIEAFQQGEDIHRRTAAEVAGIEPQEVTDEQRARAKAVNFGIIYGSSAFGLSNQLGIASAEAQETIDAYFERYQGVRRFLDETVERAKADGYVTTFLGRRRYLPDLASRNRVLRQAAERMAVNTVIQGTEADLIKKAMVEVDALLEAEGHAARLILQVHDELVFEVPEGEVDAVTELARGCMQGVAALAVPLVVDVGVGRDWREAH